MPGFHGPLGRSAGAMCADKDVRFLLGVNVFSCFLRGVYGMV